MNRIGALCAVAIALAACGGSGSSGDGTSSGDVPTSSGGAPTSSGSAPSSSGSTSSGGGVGSSSSSGGGGDAGLPDRCDTPPCANGERCLAGSDCASLVCLDRVCLAASGNDGIKNGTETDIDCGGDPSGALRCADERVCLQGSDCQSKSCADGVCIAPTRSDGIQNGTETGVDCGGGAPTNAPRCGVGLGCSATADCDGVLCENGTCSAPRSNDGIKNGTETDIDCGGGAPTNAPRCAVAASCGVTSDCAEVLCENGTCSAPRNDDGIKNGTESDIDCGGGAPTNAARCGTGKACGALGDCSAALCENGTCSAPRGNDGIKNGTETDIDCGGGAPTNAPRCPVAAACLLANDCNQAGCVGGACTYTSTDGFRNGTESDVDCGGGAPTNAPRCIVDAQCGAHTDCGSSACAISGPKVGRCVPSKSCVKNDGGFTCGRGDTDFGGATNAYESCCETAAVSGSAARVNRFAITAGRMRAFIERFAGNIRGYVQNANTKPAGWNANWDVLVPSNVAEAENMLGPYWNNAPNDPNVTAEAPHSKRSCGYAGYNGHTYWVSSNTAQQVYTQAQLDPKILNCVGWHLITAFCAWDGGRVARASELQSAFTNGYTTSYPWQYPGSQYNTPYNEAVADSRLNHRYAYGFPGGTPGTNRITWWLSPPGRFWRGWNANKIEIAGNALEWTSDAEYGFVWNMSFEQHTGNMNWGGDWRSPNDRTDVPNGYYALGARCAYDP